MALRRDILTAIAASGAAQNYAADPNARVRIET
jgi:hypothetical protein